MPRIVPDPTKAVSGFLTYPKGEYVVEIRDPKSFYTPPRPGKNENYGVRFDGKIISSIDQPGFVGKPFPVQCFQHTDGALDFSKGIQMAALGCKKDEEFNEKYGGEDWSFNTDDKSCGEGWHKMSGQVIKVTIGDVKMDPTTGDEQTGNMKYSIAK